MLEDLIIGTFRRVRTWNRERRARWYDVDARNQDQYAGFYETTQRAIDLMDVPESMREDVRVALNRHRAAANEARRHAANIRAGRRPRA